MSQMDKLYPRKNDEPKPDPSIAKAYIEGVKQFLSSFKTTACELEYEHDVGSCGYWHQHDRRRNPYSKHSFMYFTDVGAAKENLG